MTGAFTAAGWCAPCFPRLQSGPQQGQKLPLSGWSAKAWLGEGEHLAQCSSAAASQLLLFSFPVRSVSSFSAFMQKSSWCVKCWQAQKKNTYLLVTWAWHPTPSPRALLSQPTLRGKHSRINPTKLSTAWNRASEVLLWPVSPPAWPNTFSSLVSSRSVRTWHSSITHRAKSTAPPLHLSPSLCLLHAHSHPCLPFSSQSWAAPLWGPILPSGYG